ncbi:MAG: hypothetical protein V7K48_30675 [Nostoc sp.]|uniref:hypothetical protein n=1 Tax=Nostoc sp. TaxID=1180 RepID=UPI002FFB086D
MPAVGCANVLWIVTRAITPSHPQPKAIAFHNFPQLDIVKWLQQLHSYGLLSGSFRIVFYPIENCCKIY